MPLTTPVSPTRPTEATSAWTSWSDLRQTGAVGDVSKTMPSPSNEVREPNSETSESCLSRGVSGWIGGGGETLVFGSDEMVGSPGRPF